MRPESSPIPANAQGAVPGLASLLLSHRASDPVGGNRLASRRIRGRAAERPHGAASLTDLICAAADLAGRAGGADPARPAQSLHPGHSWAASRLSASVADWPFPHQTRRCVAGDEPDVSALACSRSLRLRALEPALAPSRTCLLPDHVDTVLVSGDPAVAGTPS